MTIAKHLEHTLLKPEATVEDIMQLCSEARKYGLFRRLCESVLCGAGQTSAERYERQGCDSSRVPAGSYIF